MCRLASWFTHLMFSHFIQNVGQPCLLSLSASNLVSAKPCLWNSGNHLHGLSFSHLAIILQALINCILATHQGCWLKIWQSKNEHLRDDSGFRNMFTMAFISIEPEQTVPKDIIEISMPYEKALKWQMLTCNGQWYCSKPISAPHGHVAMVLYIVSRPDQHTLLQYSSLAINPPSKIQLLPLILNLHLFATLQNQLLPHVLEMAPFVHLWLIVYTSTHIPTSKMYVKSLFALGFLP